MKRGINYSKLLLGFSLCMAFVFSAGFHNKETKVHAAAISGKYADTTIYGQKYMEQWIQSISRQPCNVSSVRHYDVASSRILSDPKGTGMDETV